VHNFSGTNKECKEQIRAVRVGYVRDKTNPFVNKHRYILRSVAKLLEMEENMAE